MGLLSGVLPAVYSASDTLKRKVGGLLSDPVGTLQQHVGLLNDNARSFNQLHSKATQESVNSIKSGGSGFGPASQQLAGKLADAYNPMGMVVWHGSPHKFSKFDSSKIGTGEGAQAYGHGLYLAESGDVAKQYRDKLTDPAFKYAGMNEAKMRLNEKIAKRVEKKDPARAAALRAEIESLGEPGGSLYKVDLPDDAIAKMLDWDKPLSQQPHVIDLINKQEAARTQAVLDQRLQTLANVGNDAPNAATLKRQIEILREEVANPQGSGLGSMTGGEYYNYLRRRDVPPSEQANMFNGAGIPGIRYLDGGSRGVGQGTSNFVVFPGNEGLLNILERNGQPIK